MPRVGCRARYNFWAHASSTNPREDTAMAKVVRFHQTGGPEVLKIENESDMNAPVNGP